MKKSIYVILSLVTLFSMLLSGCASPAAPTAAPATQAPAPTTAPAAPATQAPAAVQPTAVPAATQVTHETGYPEIPGLQPGAVRLLQASSR